MEHMEQWSIWSMLLSLRLGKLSIPHPPKTLDGRHHLANLVDGIGFGMWQASRIRSRPSATAVDDNAFQRR
jgi:hypothetical protein